MPEQKAKRLNLNIDVTLSEYVSPRTTNALSALGTPQHSERVNYITVQYGGKDVRTAKNSKQSAQAKAKNFEAALLQFEQQYQASQAVSHAARAKSAKQTTSRDERSLQNHESYRRFWSKQMELSIAARDALEGKVNQTQKEKDATLTEKMDGECATLNEVKKVLTASFERKADKHVRNSWVSSLRSLQVSLGRD